MRETIAVALFALLNTAAMKTSFPTISRRPKMWDDAIEMPALYMAQPEEDQAYKNGTATPGELTIDFDLFVYLNTALDPNIVPDTAVNNSIDAIETALRVGVMPGYPQTLGGLVQRTWIEGKIQRAPGYLDGHGAIFMTIRVLVP